ncbi:hypothetical protein A5CPEGH6_22150 [Alistipes dispar]|uniref:NVEALA protein n=2 Tax=Alistipes dispar TaxID=2585119 RepID=A0A4Y1X2N4_9BACT|nr:hypothetical protein A5CPEGH6_22150 [Alistipes dispar]
MDCFTVTVKFEKNYNLFNLKFSCMKKKLIFAGAVVLMAAAAVTAYMANYRPDPFDLLNANIEALAQDESLDPGEGRDFIYCIYNPNYGGPGIFVCSGNNECRFEYNLTWPTKSQTGICYQ